MVYVFGPAGRMPVLIAHPASSTDSFSPGSAVLDRAQRVVTAFEQAKGGACQVDGKMVDVPVVKAARRAVTLTDRAA
jgi:(S)-citramalyl-CoA lyase